MGLLEKFDRWDYDGNGQLSPAELSEAERIGGFSVDEIIKFYDTSGNRQISLIEAQAGIPRIDEARDIADDLQD